MYCSSKSGVPNGHVGIYVGYYIDRNGKQYDHAVIHSQGPIGSVVTAESLIGSRFSQEDAKYTEYNYLQYDVEYADTHPALMWIVDENLK